MSCLIEDFIVRDEVACPPKVSGTSTSTPPPAPTPTLCPINVNESGSNFLLEEPLQDMDRNDRPFE